MKLSIIIPVYNISAYLEECVQSVLQQTFTDYEIILVDDGSTDDSPIICDRLAKQASQGLIANGERLVKVIHKPNGGLSDARNAGLLAAKGEYIHFLDGDDYYTTAKDLQTLVDELERQKNPDILLFCRRDVYYKSPEAQRSSVLCPESMLVITERPYDTDFINSCASPTEIFRHLLTKQRFNMSACFQLLRREMLIDNEAFFTKGLRNEDIDWSIALWQKVQSIRAVNCVAYSYRHRANSISTTYQWRDIESYEYMFSKWLPILEQEDSELAHLQLCYLAFIYPTLLYAYYFLPKEDRGRAKEVMRKMSSVLQYSTTKKPLRIKKSIEIFGFNATLHIFASYRMIRLVGVREWWKRK